MNPVIIKLIQRSVIGKPDRADDWTYSLPPT